MSGKAREQRRSGRRKTNLKTTITSKGSMLACRLVNISADGALITASFHPPVGSSVELDLPGSGPVTATVVRVTSAYIALNFEAPVDVDMVAGEGASLGQTTAAQATA